jgi:RNA polymerase sigma-70 factor (ECF subfamily)
MRADVKSTTREAPADWIEEVLRRFERPLVAYAARLIGDAEGARDVVQDTFLALCRKPRKQVEAHLAEWLYTVCRNRALDVLRRENRMRSMEDTEAAPRLDGTPGPDVALEAHETHSHVVQLLDELPAKQREVVRLKFQHGLSYREIAAVTKQSAGTVGWLIHTAIATLRSQMQSGAGDTETKGMRA